MYFDSWSLVLIRYVHIALPITLMYCITCAKNTQLVLIQDLTIVLLVMHCVDARKYDLFYVYILSFLD